MSLKLIELQVAIPRTQDMGRFQEQVNQRAQLQQDLLGNAAIQEEEKKRRQVTKNNEVDKSLMRNKNTLGKNLQTKDSTNSEMNEEGLQEQHPYKGNFIDFVG